MNSEHQKISVDAKDKDTIRNYNNKASSLDEREDTETSIKEHHDNSDDSNTSVKVLEMLKDASVIVIALEDQRHPVESIEEMKGIIDE